MDSALAILHIKFSQQDYNKQVLVKLFLDKPVGCYYPKPGDNRREKDNSFPRFVFVMGLYNSTACNRHSHHDCSPSQFNQHARYAYGLTR